MWVQVREQTWQLEWASTAKALIHKFVKLVVAPTSKNAMRDIVQLSEPGANVMGKL